MTYEGGIPPVLIDISLAHELHLRRQLGLEDADHLRHPGLAIDVGEHGRPAQTHCARTERQQCQDVRGSPHAAVSIDLKLTKDFRVILVHVQKDLNCRGGKVHDAAAVVGDVHGLEAEVGAQLHVVCRLDALGYNRERGHVL